MPLEIRTEALGYIDVAVAKLVALSVAERIARHAWPGRECERRANPCTTGNDD
jgi:hypothetical protein